MVGAEKAGRRQGKERIDLRIHLLRGGGEQAVVTARRARAATRKSATSRCIIRTARADEAHRTRGRRA